MFQTTSSPLNEVANYQTPSAEIMLKFQQINLKKRTKKQLIRTKTSCFFLNKN
jgi:hypothetical protein